MEKFAFDKYAFNINSGTDSPVLERSGTLKEYSEFVEVVRRLKKQGASLKAAIRQGIAECEGQRILKEFLKGHAGEAFTMLHVEWKLDEALKVTHEEGLEEGWEKGREEYQWEIVRKLIGFWMRKQSQGKPGSR